MAIRLGIYKCSNLSATKSSLKLVVVVCCSCASQGGLFLLLELTFLCPCMHEFALSS